MVNFLTRIAVSQPTDSFSLGLNQVTLRARDKFSSGSLVHTLQVYTQFCSRYFCSLMYLTSLYQHFVSYICQKFQTYPIDVFIVMRCNDVVLLPVKMNSKMHHQCILLWFSIYAFSTYSIYTFHKYAQHASIIYLVCLIVVVNPTCES